MIEPVTALRRRFRRLSWVARRRLAKHRRTCICRDGRTGWQCAICQGLPDDNRRNSKLCEQCQGWDDLNHVLFCTQDNYLDENDIIEIENRGGENAMLRNLVFYPLEKLMRREECLVCNRIAVALQEHLGQAVNVQVAIGRLFLFGTFGLSGFRDGPNQSILKICVATRENGSTKYSPLALELILHYKQPGKLLDNITRWDRSYVNIDLVTRWLSNCQKYHNEKCNGLVVPMSLPRHFRLVDTTKWCITELLEQPVAYFALSYVWRAASAPTDVVSATPFQLELGNLEQLVEEDGLRTSPLPALLKDAIQLCADMGQKYLWIDRLCIVQDDEASRSHQIAAMGAIYHMATLTIVALGDTVGLPGISIRPRPSNLNENSWTFSMDGPICLGSHELHIGRVTNNSIWNKRGWTYQEQVLSRRTLIFSQGRIYLNCEHEHYGEDDYALIPDQVAEEVAQKAPSEYLNNALGVNLWQDGQQHYNYQCLVAEYLGRCLTHSSDILNAFSGVETVMRQQFQTSFLFGHPEKYFLLALLWAYSGRTGPSDMALKVPSWSWAAWDFSASNNSDLYGYPVPRLGVSHPNDIGHLVRIYYSDPATKRVRMVNEDRKWFNHSTISNDAKRSKDWWIDGLRFMDSEPVPKSIWAHSPWEAERRANISDEAISLAESFPGSLTFVTTCAVVGLANESRFDEPYNGNCISFKLLDDKSDTIGDMMRMETGWAKKTFTCRKSYDAIVLGAGRPLKRSDRTGDVMRGRKHRRYTLGNPFALYVMIIAPVGKVWRRLAIGAVNPRAWTEMKPVWKSITLI
ncbi:Heterokaryon incompatibility protein (HET) domain containing protein [Hyaloscypha variabilis]